MTDTAASTPLTPSLSAYRSQHRIQVDDSGPLPVCAVDGIKVHPTRAGGWLHDQPTILRLHREDVKAMVDGAYPNPCFVCKRPLTDGLFVRIDFGRRGSHDVRNVCDDCVERAS